MTFYAVIEAGGTKFNCAIVDEHRKIHEEARFPTLSPDETLDSVTSFFIAQRTRGYKFNKLGLACFGPLDLNPESDSFGSIVSTPKPLWSNTKIKQHLASALECEVFIDTDVNAAALAEYKWGASQGASANVYITVGTGVGGGVVINGQTLKGLVHPELGHMLIPSPEGIEGVCPFHGNCVEGLASGSSMGKIWQKDAQDLPPEHPAWDIEASVLAHLCHNIMLAYSPQSIVLGGGVMSHPGLIQQIIIKTADLLNAYVGFPKNYGLDKIITAPGLGTLSGIFGALALIDE